MKNALKIIAIGVLIGFLLFLVDQTFRFFSGMPLELDLVSLGFYVLYSVPLSFVNSYFFSWVNHGVSWGEYKKYRFIFGLLGSVGITLITIFFIRIIHKVTIEGNSYNVFIQSEKFQFYFIALIITLVISLFFHAFYFYKELQKSRINEQKIIAGTASAKFESLKNQIDPHFLFNSLNVLTSLIEENPENAQKFTTSLSKIYRYVLEQKDKELVSLEEELNFARTYMDLLKMRFEDSVSYEVPTILSNPEAKVVPLSLQLLLENAIKHNAISEKRPLKIRIYEEGNYLVIENNYQKKEVLQNRNGVGLQNIISRYHLISNRKVKIEQNTATFRISLPILTKKFTVMETYNSSENNAYYKAKQRVGKMKDFYGNLFAFFIVIPILILINYNTYWDFQWFWFPMFGWGLGVSIHGFSVFGYAANWEERKIADLLAKKNNETKIWK